jgi:hypothetical protein
VLEALELAVQVAEGEAGVSGHARFTLLFSGLVNHALGDSFLFLRRKACGCGGDFLCKCKRIGLTHAAMDAAEYERSTKLRDDKWQDNPNNYCDAPGRHPTVVDARQIYC